MTPSWLMEADCIHGNTWYECEECDRLMAEDPVLAHLEPVEDDDEW